jgi:hypothetical protein
MILDPILARFLSGPFLRMTGISIYISQSGQEPSRPDMNMAPPAMEDMAAALVHMLLCAWKVLISITLRQATLLTG